MENRTGTPPFSFRSLGIAFTAAALSVFCYRTGFFNLFFLFPLGLAAFSGGVKTAWAGGIAAAAGNIIVSLWFYLYRPGNVVLFQWNAFYYTVMTLIFTWINAPISRFGAMVNSTYRLAAGSVLCSLLIGPFLMDDSLLRHFSLQLVSFNSAAGDFSGIAAEEVAAAVVYIGLRGGLLASCMLFFAISRQFAAVIIRLGRNFSLSSSGKEVPKQETGPDRQALLNFHVPFFLIWILSLSFGVVLAGRMKEAEFFEIGGWNILVLCSILYLVQGGAVALHYLIKAPPSLRILANVGVIIAFVTPGVNAAVLGVLIILGLAENWVPFRKAEDASETGGM